MRKTVFLILLISITINAQDTLRVLAVGNSFSADALEHWFVPVCRAGGVEVVACNLYIPSCTLRDHLRHMQADDPVYEMRRPVTPDSVAVTDSVRLSAAMSACRWDVVTLQQASYLSGQWSSYTPYLGALIDSVRRRCPDARIGWHRTWAYPQQSRLKSFARYHYSQREMDDAIADCARRVRTNYPIDVLIPVGEAVMRARASRLGDTLCRDRLHLNRTYGQWLASLVWYRALTGRETDMETVFIPDCIDKETARIILQCVGDEPVPGGGTEKGDGPN